MLTDAGIRTLKPGAKPLKRSDGGGLFILVTPDGRKGWRLAYRLDGKQKLLSGGSYPKVGLRAARHWRDQVPAQLTLGMDPSAARRQAREERAVKEVVPASRFREVAAEWLATRELSWSPRYAYLVKGRLDADIYPVIGEMDVAQITPRQILDAIRRIEARGSIEMAHRVKNHCSEERCGCVTDPGSC